MEYRDYYKILGVKKDASADEIKRAFRKLARANHPDVASDKDDAEEKFKAINEAYEVLGDPEKRKKYDQLGSNWDKVGDNWGQSGGGYPGGGGGGFEYSFGGSTGFSDFFEEIFGRRTADPFGGYQSTRGRTGSRAGRDVESDFLISIDELMSGGERQIRLQDGNTGKVKTIKVKIPVGATDGTRIRLAGLGEPGIGNGPAGDLYLKLRLERHPNFTFDGTTVNADVELSPSECVLGVQKLIKTPKGNVRLKIPPGTQSDTTFRIPGHGLPKKDGNGMFCANIRVKIPESITDEQKAHWEALA